MVIILIALISIIQATKQSTNTQFDQIYKVIIENTVQNEYVAPSKVLQTQRKGLQKMCEDDVEFNKSPQARLIHLFTLCTVMQSVCRSDCSQNEVGAYQLNFDALLEVVSQIEEIAIKMKDGWKWLFYAADSLRALEKCAEELGIADETVAIVNGRYFLAMEWFVSVSEEESDTVINDMFLWFEQAMKSGDLIFDTLEHCLMILDDDDNAKYHPSALKFRKLLWMQSDSFWFGELEN